MTTIVPFLRPELLRQRGEVKALYITGSLGSAKPGQAYEGRLQVINPVGDFEIIGITGSVLPPGSDVFADNGADDIVVRWPAYSESASTIPNGDFDTGTLANWTITKFGENPLLPATGSVSASRPPPGFAWSAFWQGNVGTGHAGGVEAVWENSFEGVCAPGRSVTAVAQIALDDTDSSQNRGRVRIHFYNAADVLLNPDDVGGNVIRGNNEEYQVSTVTRTAPPGTTYAKIAVWTTANASSGSGVRFGNVYWNLPDTVGINTEATFCFTATVRDSAGRTAQWSGCVTVEILSWRATQFLPLTLNDAVWAEFGGQRMLFVFGQAVAGTTTIYKSVDDGETFTPISIGGATYALGTGAYGNGAAIFRQNFNNYVRTVDGVNFTTHSLPITDGYYNTLWTGAGFLLLGNGNGARSATGASGTWTPTGSIGDVRGTVLIPNPTPGQHGRVIAFISGLIYYTDDGGATFVPVTFTDPLPANSWSGAYLLNGVVIAYKVQGTTMHVVSSADNGVTWANQSVSWPNSGTIPSAANGVVVNGQIKMGFSAGFSVTDVPVFSSPDGLPPFSSELVQNTGIAPDRRALGRFGNGHAAGRVDPITGYVCWFLRGAAVGETVVIAK